MPEFFFKWKIVNLHPNKMKNWHVYKKFFSCKILFFISWNCHNIHLWIMPGRQHVSKRELERSVKNFINTVTDFPRKNKIYKIIKTLQIIWQKWMKMKLMSKKMCKTWFILLSIFRHVQIKKNHVFCNIFSRVNVCGIRICHLLHFLLDIRCTTFYIWNMSVKRANNHCTIYP